VGTYLEASSLNFSPSAGRDPVKAMSAGTRLESFSEAKRRARLLGAAEILGVSLKVRARDSSWRS